MTFGYPGPGDGYDPQAYRPEGQPQYGQAPGQFPGQFETNAYAQHKSGKNFGLAALILGILALLGSWIPIINIVSIIMAFIAIGLGVVAILRAKNPPAEGKGMGIAGIVLGAFAVVISVAILVIVGVAASELTSP